MNKNFTIMKKKLITTLALFALELQDVITSIYNVKGVDEVRKLEVVKN